MCVSRAQCPPYHPRIRRKRKHDVVNAEPHGGFFWTGLSDRLRDSLVEFARRSLNGARRDGRLALAALDAAKLARREERVTALLNAAVEHYAYSLELFDAWQQQRAKSGREIEAVIKDKPEAQQLEFLRKQIEMRVLGLGWDKYSTRWSSNADERVGTVAHLKALLVNEIIPEETALERLNDLPTEAAPPHHKAAVVKALGTADADALDIESKALFSTEELKAKAEAARQRRVEAGVQDNVENMQPLQPPAFNQELVGKRIEVSPPLAAPSCAHGLAPLPLPLYLHTPNPRSY